MSAAGLLDAGTSVQRVGTKNRGAGWVRDRCGGERVWERKLAGSERERKKGGQGKRLQVAEDATDLARVGPGGPRFVRG